MVEMATLLNFNPLAVSLEDRLEEGEKFEFAPFPEFGIASSVKEDRIQDLLIYRRLGREVELYQVTFCRDKNGDIIRNSRGLPDVNVVAHIQTDYNTMNFYRRLISEAKKGGYAVIEATTNQSAGYMLARSIQFYRNSVITNGAPNMTDWKQGGGFGLYWKKDFAVGKMPDFKL